MADVILKKPGYKPTPFMLAHQDNVRQTMTESNKPQIIDQPKPRQNHSVAEPLPVEISRISRNLDTSKVLSPDLPNDSFGIFDKPLNLDKNQSFLNQSDFKPQR